MTKAFLVGLIGLFAGTAWAGVVDGSVAELLPPAVSKPLTATSEFPLFWWNFLILEASDDQPPNWSSLDSFCAQVPDARVVKTWACGSELASYQDGLADWSKDQFRRGPPPSLERLQTRFSEALVKASLPLEPQFLTLLRMDPLETYKSLIGLASAHAPLRLGREHGFFFDPESHRVIIPVQFAFPPAQTAPTRAFTESLSAPPGWMVAGLIGPHASTLENETRVYKDVELVGWVSAILLSALILGCLLLKRWRLIWLAPPVLFSTAVSAVLTIAIFGRIHGLTLAFGPGIVGLALDHGLHSCLNMRWRGAWRANFYGLVTTLAGLVVFLASSVPFLRQLAAFSLIGLICGFVLYRGLHRRYPEIFEVEPLPWEPKGTGWKFFVSIAIAAGVTAGAFMLRPDFGMRHLNFQPPRQEALGKWTLSQLTTRSPLALINSAEKPLANSQEQLQWADERSIPVQTAARFLPPELVQTKNIAAWRALICDRTWTETETKFFAPFFTLFPCQPTAPRDLVTPPPPAYLRDFTNGRQWLSMWFPATPDQETAIQQQFPEAVSLPQIIERFPVILSSEVGWMAPLAIVIAIALLSHYYRDWRHVAIALMPFLTGVGLYSWVAVVQSYSFSFVSLIALVMVFGLSLDYGIFAVNLYTGRLGPSPRGVWTSVILAAVVTMIGFGPLILCQHPVLAHLGQVLFWGTAGTVVGCVWGIPGLHWWLEKSEAVAAKESPS